MNGKKLRLKKLFNKSNNTVIVAIDHDMFDGPIPNQAGFQAALCDMVKHNFHLGKQCISTEFYND